MSIFDILEGRMQEIFEVGRVAAPFGFKQLAHMAVNQMKRSSVKLDGVKHAPTLFTILINPADDVVMAPLYQQITFELVDFLAHEAENVSLHMDDTPVVRFVANQDVHPGKPEVIAEVVPAEILAEVRAEEESYNQSLIAQAAGSRSRQAIAARASLTPQQRQVQAQAQTVPAAPARQRVAAQARQAQAPVFVDDYPEDEVPTVPQARQAQAPAPAEPFSANRVCELLDQASGKSWRISAPTTVIGREGGNADLLLSDTNVSRRHAQLELGEDGWTITDLNSTNGTRVNGQRVQTAELTSGDIITLGLIDLAFSEL